SAAGAAGAFAAAAFGAAALAARGFFSAASAVDFLAVVILVVLDGEAVHAVLALAVLRKHRVHGVLERLGRVGGHDSLHLGLAHTARVTGVGVVVLVFQLATGHLDLGGVADFDDVTGVDVRNVARQVLALKQHGDLGGEAANALPRRIDRGVAARNCFAGHRVEN